MKLLYRCQVMKCVLLVISNKQQAQVASQKMKGTFIRRFAVKTASLQTIPISFVLQKTHFDHQSTFKNDAKRQ